MHKRILFLSATLPALALLLLACSSTPKGETVKVRPDYPSNAATARAYADILRDVEDKRKELASGYQSSEGETRDKLLEEGRKYLLNVMVDEVFPAWFGTPWDFNGVTRTPGEGYIACGYFVTNVLTDLGFDIPRVKWAQSASEYYIKRMSTNIKRFSNRPVSEVTADIQARGDGIYVVGLDQHAGFVYKRGNEIRFVHSNYYVPKKGVMAQKLDSENPLRDSGYRVIGKIFGDDMMRHWLKGTRME